MTALTTILIPGAGPQTVKLLEPVLTAAILSKPVPALRMSPQAPSRKVPSPRAPLEAISPTILRRMSSTRASRAAPRHWAMQRCERGVAAGGK